MSGIPGLVDGSTKLSSEDPFSGVYASLQATSHKSHCLTNNTRNLKLKTQLTIAFCTTVNHNYDDN